MIKVFIDGKAGTTGLKIFERLSARDDVELLSLGEELRKDPKARKEMLNAADVAFLCLPDDASREAVSMIDNDKVVVIDTSTAHRTLVDWAYGFAELSKNHFDKISTSKRIAVPGCHASGFIALVYPLIEEGLVKKDILLSVTSITGYSGGGKKMIAEYEDDNRDVLLSSPRQYAITQNHKHLKEMVSTTGLSTPPIFSPIVADFFSGMVVSVPLFKDMLVDNKTIDDIKDIYKKYYNDNIVKYVDCIDESGFIAANKLAGKDSMEISVVGNDERILLAARYDNLGKGASGAAIECMNIAMSLEKEKGLVL